ncbi:P-loop containing nucleoside triphosphate hydrolase protein [Polychytrium aggregatum]|uniref:P-loop containing nucleoside triphosphate hydrolase protein n=1 Tax=Polychytrium aggregatum TaxID=110093 RepID=UPI0022FF3C41|nr:P-loop containing nucleoside triphosphate hydrolase protein [Polychytrium aggregatum]KAI9204201.1 P-loop containing nucleoside triphosphate hydrolase protein [Polychytrium aggregatum]
MVPKKGKSKRVSSSQRNKIQKKVSEHRRKVRKDAKKNPVPMKKSKKDPGIPNLFPLKDKLLAQIEEQKRKSEEAKLLQKEARKAGRTSDQVALANLARDAARRSKAFGDEGSTGLDAVHTLDEAAVTSKDNSRKAYYKEFRKVVESADVILEVLDARDPLGCRTKEIEEMIINSGISKRIILILNKIDLVPREVVEQWLKYLRNEFPTVAFKASTQAQRSNLGHSSVGVDVASQNLLNSSECLGADNLIKLLKNYCRNANIKTSISVGVVGFPNVGKSSVINSLKRSRVCGVGSTPGVTKSMQEISLDKNIKLLDCPGIVFSRSTGENDRAEVLLRNCVKVELLEDPIAPVELIVSRCKKEQLMLMYQIPSFQSTQEFLLFVAKQRGKLKRGGIPNIDGAARSILQDWNSGRIPFYTVPPATGPAVDTHVSSAVVQSWSAEFQLPEIIEVEGKDVLSSVKAKGDHQQRFLTMQPSNPTAIELEDEAGEYLDGDDEEMDEDEDDDGDDEDFDDEDGGEDDDDDDDADDDDGDDDDEMDDEDMDDDTAAKPAAGQSQILLRNISVPKKVQETAANSVSAMLSASEKEINLQSNRDQKKLLKNRRKRERRGIGHIPTDDPGEEGSANDSYDFGRYFPTLPGHEDMDME